MVIYSYVIKEFTPSLLRSYIFSFPNSLDCLGNYTFCYRGFGLMSGLPLGSCLDCTVGLSFHISKFLCTGLFPWLASVQLHPLKLDAQFIIDLELSFYPISLIGLRRNKIFPSSKNISNDNIYLAFENVIKMLLTKSLKSFRMILNELFLRSVKKHQICFDLRLY